MPTEVRRTRNNFSTDVLLVRPSEQEPFKAYWSRDAPTVLTFNNCTLCPHCIYVFCIYLRTNSDLCHLQHKLIGFYNGDKKCLQRGTDWVFKYSGLRLVFKGLIFLTHVCNHQRPLLMLSDILANANVRLAMFVVNCNG